MRFQPFPSNPVRYTPPCTITVKLGGTPVKSNSPPVFNLLNNWNQAASFVCSTTPSPWNDGKTRPAISSPHGCRALDPVGAWWGDLCALIKPTSIHPGPPRVILRLSLSRSCSLPIFLPFCSVLDPSMEVSKDGQIMERSHRGYEDYQR